MDTISILLKGPSGRNRRVYWFQKVLIATPPIGISSKDFLADVMRGGTVSVSQYRASALRACSASNVDQPWACIDLVYVVTLLQEVYKIKDTEPISVSRS